MGIIYFILILALICSFSVIKEIFSKVDEHIEKGDLIVELNMSALPSLYEQFVQLIEYLVCIASVAGCSLPQIPVKKHLKSLQKENKREDKDQVVIVLLNMLEVVTRDIMEDTVPR